MLPGRDVRFLRAITRGMAAEALNCYKPSSNRAATALVLRFPAADGVKVAKLFGPLDRGAPTSDILDRLEANVDPDAPSSLRLFFMLRADSEADRWSGQVAFPGGKRDTVLDRDDLDTARREAYEEVGMPLESPEFVLLGRMPDYRVRSRNLSHMQGGLTLARFVFLHIGELTPSTRLSRHEVAAAQWVPVAALDRKNLRWNRIGHPIVNFIHYFYMDTKLTARDLFPNTRVFFPCIPLSVVMASEAAKGGPSADGFTTSPNAPSGMPNWDLWGLTLTSVSALFEMEGRQRIDWPVFRCNNPVLQWLVVHPYHGYLTVADGVRPIMWESLASLFLIVATFLVILEAVVTFVQAFAFMWRTARRHSKDHSALIEREGTGSMRTATFEYLGRLTPTHQKARDAKLDVAFAPALERGPEPAPPETPEDRGTLSMWSVDTAKPPPPQQQQPPPEVAAPV